MYMQILEAITVGLPFCAFKLISGVYFHQYWLIVLGIIDIFINVTNIVSMIVLKRRFLEACFISFLVGRFKRAHAEAKMTWEDLGNSTDIFLSFVLVALMIGGGHIPKLSPDQLFAWNISVIFNVIGAGLYRLTDSIKKVRRL